jgi:hypothetical protein
MKPIFQLMMQVIPVLMINLPNLSSTLPIPMIYHQVDIVYRVALELDKHFNAHRITNRYVNHLVPVSTKLKAS